MGSVIGQVGLVIAPTRGKDGAGEVSIAVGGSREVYLAWSKDPIPKGTQVLVIDECGVRTVTVESY